MLRISLAGGLGVERRRRRTRGARRDRLRLGGPQPCLGDPERGAPRERLGDQRVELRIAVTVPPQVRRPGRGIEPRPRERLLRAERLRLAFGGGLPVTAGGTARGG